MSNNATRTTTPDSGRALFLAEVIARKVTTGWSMSDDVDDFYDRLAALTDGDEDLAARCYAIINA